MLCATLINLALVQGSSAPCGFCFAHCVCLHRWALKAMRHFLVCFSCSALWRTNLSPASLSQQQTAEMRSTSIIQTYRSLYNKRCSCL